MGAEELLLMATPRQKNIASRKLKVLGLLSRGWTDEDMAHELGVAIATIKRDAKALREQFGARNSTHLVAIAYEKGIL